MTVDPATAYEHAPQIVQEIGWIARQGTGGVAEIGREFWLRKAALVDRIALHEEAEYTPGIAASAVRAAEEAASQLIAEDSRPDGELGPRAYVRQEYLAWIRAGGF